MKTLTLFLFVFVFALVLRAQTTPNTTTTLSYTPPAGWTQLVHFDSMRVENIIQLHDTIIVDLIKQPFNYSKDDKFGIRVYSINNGVTWDTVKREWLTYNFHVAKGISMFSDVEYFVCKDRNNDSTFIVRTSEFGRTVVKNLKKSFIGEGLSSLEVIVSYYDDNTVFIKKETSCGPGVGGSCTYIFYSTNAGKEFIFVPPFSSLKNINTIQTPTTTTYGYLNINLSQPHRWGLGYSNLTNGNVDSEKYFETIDNGISQRQDTIMNINTYQWGFNSPEEIRTIITEHYGNINPKSLQVGYNSTTKGIMNWMRNIYGNFSEKNDTLDYTYPFFSNHSFPWEQRDISFLSTYELNYTASTKNKTYKTNLHVTDNDGGRWKQILSIDINADVKAYPNNDASNVFVAVNENSSSDIWYQRGFVSDVEETTASTGGTSFVLEHGESVPLSADAVTANTPLKLYDILGSVVTTSDFNPSTDLSFHIPYSVPNGVYYIVTTTRINKVITVLVNR